MEKSICRRATQATRRFPVGTHQIVERSLSVFGQWVSGFRLWSAKVKRDSGRNPVIERGCDTAGIAAARNGSQK